MDRYEKVKKIENLQLVINNLQKLLDNTKAELEEVAKSEIPILIGTNIDEDNVYYVYYLADIDRIKIITNELLPNTLDLQGKVNFRYDVVGLKRAKKYLNSLITKIIVKNKVDNWMDVGILLEKEINNQSLKLRKEKI